MMSLVAIAGGAAFLIWQWGWRGAVASIALAAILLLGRVRKG